LPSSQPEAPAATPGGLVLEPDDSPHHPLAPWFEMARGRRAEHSSVRRWRRRRRALVTIVHNEPVFLPLWLRYYSRFFRPRDIYVLDNESTDGSTLRDGFVRIPAAHDSVDHEWMASVIGELQHELIGRYDAVLVTDVDEIVVPHPRLGTLGDYIDHFDEGWVNCLGYELLHMRDSEPPIRLDRPILEQRHHWFYNDGYDKAALATVPLDYKPGLHGRTDHQFQLDPDLRMIHLHRMDYDLCLERHRTRSHKPWADEDERQRWAIHNRITEEQAFRHWFYEDSSVVNLEIQPERIPDTWRRAF
jgi:hypothetical protein